MRSSVFSLISTANFWIICPTSGISAWIASQIASAAPGGGLILDGRLYLFYEGVTSLDARNGEERRREKALVAARLEAIERAAVAQRRAFGRGRIGND